MMITKEGHEMHNNKILFAMIATAVLMILSPANLLACVDGCSSLALSLNDFVIIQAVTGETPCNPACGSNGVQYTLIKVSSCGGFTVMTGTSCSSDLVSLLVTTMFSP